ncbi:MAG: hypothetical protein ABI761_11050 [Saprospiraceae bacterium]
MYRTVEYFEGYEKQKIFELLLQILGSKPVVLIRGIADKSKLYDFYDTDEWRDEHKRSNGQNQEIIGSWWSRGYEL